MSGNVEVCKLLIDHGSKWDEKRGIGMKTPLFFTIFHNKDECFDYLLSLGCDLTFKDTLGATYVDYTNTYSMPEMKKKLL